MFTRVLIMATALLVALAAPAAAQTAEADGYRPTNVQVVVNPDGSVDVTGDGCDPREDAVVVVRRGAPAGNGPAVQTGSADVTGDGSFAFTTQPLSPGRYTIEVTCGGRTASTFVVTPERAANPNQPGDPQNPRNGNPGAGSGSTSQSPPEVNGSTTVRSEQPARGNEAKNVKMQKASFSSTPAEADVPVDRLGVVLLAAGGIALYGGKRRHGRRAASSRD